jgi:hypothetical protein
MFCSELINTLLGSAVHLDTGWEIEGMVPRKRVSEATDRYCSTSGYYSHRRYEKHNNGYRAAALPMLLLQPPFIDRKGAGGNQVSAKEHKYQAA